ncbi:protein GLUTELIN PRECURSOR ACCUMULATION 3 [Microcaecilia unicolor]|uniref:Rab9 effector protein with kelch motifs n=1 Tax=Microcaecilia unicolor TaxID=1415580 RepID=A0A6P7ZBG1_9AMPH|nr:protein GLUTELIN PRECURSOR ACCUMULATION 3-like [Microcaecilia unicolor]
MERFQLWAVCRPQEPPLRLLRVSVDPLQYAVDLLPPFPDQLVVFSWGDWSVFESTTVEVELIGAGEPLRLGTLSSQTRCLLWSRDANDAISWMEGCTGLKLQLVVRGQLSKKGGPRRGKRLNQLQRNEGTKEPGQILAELEVTPQVDEQNGSLRQAGRKDYGKRKHCGATRGLENSCSSPQYRKSTMPKTLLFAARDKTLADHPAVPSGRWGHALCAITDWTALLIGGQGAHMKFCQDAMWKLSTEDNSWTSAGTVAEGPTPESRVGHSATFDPGTRRVYVFGGSKNQKWFNDMHILDTVSWRWSMVKACGKVPPLAYHSSTFFRGELFIFGGVFPRPHPEPDGCSDSLYIFDPQNEIWYQPIVQGRKPAARSGHSACLLQRDLYVFGGWDTPICFNDLHVLDLGLMEFSPVEVSGHSPSPRSWHASAVVSDSRFLIHGGYDGNQALSDAFSFDAKTRNWTAIVSDALPQEPRAGHSLLTIGSTDPRIEEEESREASAVTWSPSLLLVFGGGNNEGKFFSDTHKLPLENLFGQ